MERYRGRPFAFIGVNSDEDRETARSAAAKRGIVWRSWFDGMEGPIAGAWRVKFYPTTYVLDTRGVVRYVNLRGPDLDAAVETLLAEGM